MSSTPGNYHQHIGGGGGILSTPKGTSEGYHEYTGDTSSCLVNRRDIMSTLERYHDRAGGCSVH